MNSVDKLRTLPRNGTNGFGAVVTASEETFEAIADEIESEIEERYMKLPVDADGVPIRVGDKLEFYGLTFEAFSIAEDVVFRECDLKHGLYIVDVYDHSDVRHVKPRTLEDVLREMVGMTDQPICEEDIKAFADEIRELLGGDAE